MAASLSLRRLALAATLSAASLVLPQPVLADADAGTGGDESILIGGRISFPEFVEDLLLVEQLVIGFEIEVSKVLDVIGIFCRPSILICLGLISSSAALHAALSLRTRILRRRL